MGIALCRSLLFVADGLGMASEPGDPDGMERAVEVAFSAAIESVTGKRTGLSNKIREAPVFYGLVGAGTVAGMIFSLVGANPIKLLVFVAVVNGIAAAPFLLIVMLVSNSRAIMGEYVNKRLARTLGWLTFAVMAAGAVALVFTSAGG